MSRFYRYCLCLLGVLSLTSCNKEKPQIVVPVVGKQMADYQVSRENRIAQLQTEFPDTSRGLLLSCSDQSHTADHVRDDLQHA